MRRLVVLTLACTVSIGASSASAQTKHGYWLTFVAADYGLTFKYPANWQPYAYTTPSNFSTIITYLSTAPLHDPCVQTGGSTTCGSPLDTLLPRGVLVTWTENGFPNWTLQKANGRALTVSGRPAELQIIHGRGLDCPVGTQEDLVLRIARSTAFNWYEMQACLRGPRLSIRVSEVMTMIRSLRGAT